MVMVTMASSLLQLGEGLLGTGEIPGLEGLTQGRTPVSSVATICPVIRA